MKNPFIPYEMSVKLKELGFNEKCFDVYSDVKSVGMFRNSPRDRTPKILWQQAFDFLIKRVLYSEWHLYYEPSGWELKDVRNEKWYQNEKALQKLIEIVENKKG